MVVDNPEVGEKLPYPEERQQIKTFLDNHSKEIHDDPSLMLDKISSLIGVEELEVPTSTPQAQAVQDVSDFIAGVKGILEGADVYRNNLAPNEELMAKRILIINPDNWLEEYRFLSGESVSGGPRDEYSDEIGPINKLDETQFQKFRAIMWAVSEWNTQLRERWIESYK